MRTAQYKPSAEVVGKSLRRAMGVDDFAEGKPTKYTACARSGARFQDLLESKPFETGCAWWHGGPTR